jgi:hypothetical protein
MVGSRAEQSKMDAVEKVYSILGIDIEASSCALIMQDAGHFCMPPFQPDLSSFVSV